MSTRIFVKRDSRHGVTNTARPIQNTVLNNTPRRRLTPYESNTTTLLIMKENAHPSLDHPRQSQANIPHHPHLHICSKCRTTNTTILTEEEETCSAISQFRRKAMPRGLKFTRNPSFVWCQYREYEFHAPTATAGKCTRSVDIGL